MFTELERGQLAPGSSSTLTLQSMKEQLTESWRGVMDITMSLSSRDTYSPREIVLIDRLVTECASNARRHGHATTLHLDLTSTADCLTVVASDNGVGPGYGAPGLGTALMASLSAGNWSRKLSASQSGTTVTCTISRVKESTS
jgi:signal transduction histidine kinase